MGRKPCDHMDETRMGFNGWKMKPDKSGCGSSVMYMYLYIDLHESTSELVLTGGQILS